MRITPLDVRKQEFRRGVRGFDCDEVRAFLATLADEYETVLLDNKQLRERMADNEDKIGEYKNMERTLRDTLMTAERLMQDTRESANKEGELIVQDSRLQAKRILEECRMRTEELRRELNGLRKEKENYLARFKSLAEAQIQFVESHRTDFEDVDKRLTDMVDDVLEGMGTDATPEATAAPTPNRIPTPAQTAPAATTENTAPIPAPAPYREEIDQWRDYQPASKATQAQPAPAPSLDEMLPSNETAAAPAPANPWQNQTPVPEVAKPAAEAPRTGSASVELAAMGIPVPAVMPSGDAGEAIATLIEESCEQSATVPVAPYGS